MIETITTLPIGIVGDDLDADLLACLVVGDSVMLEINGGRVPSHKNQLSGHVWEVVYNNPPDGEPSDEHVLVLTNPAIGFDVASSMVQLHYSNLMNTDGPAVFWQANSGLVDEYDNPISAFVCVQFVSHYCENVEYPLPPDILQVIDDPKIKRVIFQNWSAALQRFDSKSWKHTGIYRFALRAGVAPSLIEDFKNLDWEIINQVDDYTLMGISEAFHWLPYLLGQARYLGIAKKTVTR